MVKKTIRIGTRDSQLALWQAHNVQSKLHDLGHQTEIIAVKSQGDIILDKPLYELGITGIFTKTLDIAMIKDEIDIAVHSMKDVPTALPQGVVQGAVLERAIEKDILVYKDNTDFLQQNHAIIATGSLRRKAQWLNKFPNHQLVDLRGNVNTRIQKLYDNNWNGAIFADAGLQRIDIKPQNTIDLDWMIPAPAQGAMMVVAMAKDTFTREILRELNDLETDICTHIERQFLRTLEGGCTAPIGANAKIVEDDITFKAILLSLDGKQKIEINKVVPLSDWKKLGFYTAVEVLEKGGKEIMQNIKQILKK